MQPRFAIPDLVVIPAGHFWMGSPESEIGRQRNEGPRRRRRVARPFAMARHAVTVGDFATFIREAGAPPAGDCKIWDGTDWMQVHGHFASAPLRQDADAPAVLVSWHDAQRYVAWLSRQSGLAFRLPSEAEWEYAARAGCDTAYSWGDTFDPARVHCRNVPKTERYLGAPVPVAALAPNAFGLHHMLGNVWEWTEDCWRDGYTAQDDKPARQTTGNERRAVRGGSWLNGPAGVRSARRHAAHPDSRRADIGFRVACTLPAEIARIFDTSPLTPGA